MIQLWVSGIYLSYFFLKGKILYLEYPFSACRLELTKPSFQTKTGAFIYNELNVPLNLKENCTLKYMYAFSWKIHMF